MAGSILRYDLPTFDSAFSVYECSFNGKARFSSAVCFSLFYMQAPFFQLPSVSLTPTFLFLILGLGLSSLYLENLAVMFSVIFIFIFIVKFGPYFLFSHIYVCRLTYFFSHNG